MNRTIQIINKHVSRVIHAPARLHNEFLVRMLFLADHMRMLVACSEIKARRYEVLVSPYASC